MAPFFSGADMVCTRRAEKHGARVRETTFGGTCSPAYCLLLFGEQEYRASSERHLDLHKPSTRIGIFASGDRQAGDGFAADPESFYESLHKSTKQKFGDLTKTCGCKSKYFLSQRELTFP